MRIQAARSLRPRGQHHRDQDWKPRRCTVRTDATNRDLGETSRELDSAGRRRRPIRREPSLAKACEHDSVKPDDVSRLADELDGVAERRRKGLLDWRYRGRLVARQLDDGH